MGKKQRLICSRCKKRLVPANTHFSYLGHSFRAEAMRCPGCGQVFLPEELAKGRIAQVEADLEDK